MPLSQDRSQPSSNHLPPPTMMSSSISRINQYLAEIDVDHNHKAAQRPTEAQLRWSYFHRAARAQKTKDRIDRLMKFPPNTSDVEGAHYSDGDATVADGYHQIDVNEADLPVHPVLEQKAYLGIRRDRQGEWIRRHFSRTRFPHLAAKSMQSSPCEKKSANSNSDRAVKSPRKHTTEKVEISKGRRALLRVSSRAYEDRKKQLESIPHHLHFSIQKS